MIDITEIETRLKKAQTRAEKARNAFESASSEVIRLETALSVIREMSGSIAPSTSPVGHLTQKQQIVINSLNFGQEGALSPVDVYQLASTNGSFDGDVNYVRTTLWRMADKGSIGGANGTYWKYPELAKQDEPVQFSHFGDGPGSAEEESSFVPWDDDSEVPF